MLVQDPAKRISATEALSDTWILKLTHEATVNAELALSSLQRLEKFQTHSTMQKAVLTYISCHMASKESEQHAREVFQLLDTNRDGQLSRAELLEGCKVIFHGDLALAQKQVDRAMAEVDLNKNGSIDYHGLDVAVMKA